MGYVEDQLLPGERVKYRVHLHKLIFILPVLFALLAIAGAVFAFAASIAWLGVALLLLGAIPFLITLVRYRSSEFAVTDKRVIIKVGFIKRRTLETMLGKVEGIGVEQGILGRLFGFGTITVTGTGGTKEPFPNIARPLEFRRQVQGQVSAAGEARGVMAAPAPANESGPREERDCPYCAERILARAKVCKHCGRDVQPSVAQ
ncbi:MAG TPA: PH domain-containing protein [Gemmatimonadaceae bacterium]|jgi:uncharacterized membrane protein YdbT with pleckstrin-like domain